MLLYNDNNPNLTEAMNGPDSTGFMAAVEKEIETLIAMQAFVVIVVVVVVVAVDK